MTATSKTDTSKTGTSKLATAWKSLAATGLAAGVLAATAPLASATVPPTPSTDPGLPLETPHFRVTMHRTTYHDNLAHADVTVCAKLATGEPRVRVSWDPWSLTNVHGQTFKAGMYEGGSDDEFPYGDGAPKNGKVSTERYLADGECATGTVGFAAPQEVQPKSVVYSNGYGEALVWHLDS